MPFTQQSFHLRGAAAAAGTPSGAVYANTLVQTCLLNAWHQAACIFINHYGSHLTIDHSEHALLLQLSFPSSTVALLLPNAWALWTATIQCRRYLWHPDALLLPTVWALLCMHQPPPFQRFPRNKKLVHGSPGSCSCEYLV